MSDETEMLAELMDAALDALEEGIAVLDAESRVVAWNPAAAAVSGYQRAHLLGRGLPEGFYEVDAHHSSVPEGACYSAAGAERPMLVRLHHSRGHVLPAMLRQVPLRDALGKRFGMLLRFHPTEEMDALPHGAIEEDDGLDHHVEHSLTGMKERLDEAWQEWTVEGIPFGLLWITVDQAAMLRKTHGHDASEAMLAIMERTLVHALRPAEILGRWGSNEFLVLSHERTPEMLLLHARHVGELARSADFRWWGDRVLLTVSIGAAQVEPGRTEPGRAETAGEQDEKLGGLLERARRAMQTGQLAGGDAVVLRGVENSLEQGA